MKGEKKGQRLSFMVVLFAINIISLVFLSFFNYVNFYDSGRKAYLDHFLKYNSELIEGTLDNIDGTISSILEIPDLYFGNVYSDDTLVYPQENDIEKDYVALRYIISTMNKIRQTNPMIDSIDVYYEKSGVAITGFSNLHYIKGEEELELFLPWLKYVKDGRDVHYLSYGKNSYPYESENFSYIKSFQSSKWGDDKLYVALHINPRFLRFKNNDISDFYIVSPRGDGLYSINNTANVSTLISLFTNEKGDVEEGMKRVEFQGQEYMVLNYISSNTGFEYFYTLNYGLFNTQFEDENTFLFYSLILSIITNFIVLSFLCFIDYKFFKMRFLSFSNSVGMDIDSKQSLDSSMAHVSEKIQNLSKSAKSAESLRKQQLVRSFALSLAKPEDENEFCSKYDSQSFIVSAIVETPDSDCEQKIVSLGLYEDKKLLYTMMQDTLLLFFIFTKEEDFVTPLKEIFPSSHLDFGYVFKLSPGAFKDCYDSALEVMSYRFFYKDDVLVAQSLHLRERRREYNFNKISFQLERDINLDNLDDLKTHLEQCFDLMKENNLNIDFCHSILNQFVLMTYKLFLEKQIDPYKILGYDIRTYSKTIDNSDDFLSWFVSIVEVLSEEKKAHLENLDLGLQEVIERVIDDNLEKDISLSLLAEKVGMSANTLSHSFKTIMNKNYIDYIKEKKLLRAIEYLRQDVSVQEIADRLGYRSVQYFIHIFKSSYGMTPFKYKKSVLMGIENKEDKNNEGFDDN